jgi:CRP-like cAMP-binding protein
VLSCSVKVCRSTPQGEQAVLSVFAAGQTFAEAAMFVGHRYPATGETIDDVERLAEQFADAPLRRRADPVH